MPTLQVCGIPLRNITIQKDLGKQVLHTHTPLSGVAYRLTGDEQTRNWAACLRKQKYVEDSFCPYIPVQAWTENPKFCCLET